jgi:S-methylmethionine-dependent homocysteine/selenocysteine methylase
LAVSFKQLIFTAISNCCVVYRKFTGGLPLAAPHSAPTGWRLRRPCRTGEPNMTIYRNALPQLDGGLFLTDSGLETTLIFLEGQDLPYFAAFDLLRTVDGRDRLRRYFERHIGIARDAGAGFVLESATWRASPDWAFRMGYSDAALGQVNRDAVELLAELRAAHATPALPMVISGNIGPRGDGYDPGKLMSADEAAEYHGFQVGVFRDTDADMVSAFTMTNVPEATGVVRAARAAGMPVVISFTTETDGRLPTGQALGDAITQVDAATGGYPAYFMINCAHPTHFAGALADAEGWTARIGGLCANASRLSHAELDAATELDDGDPAEFGAQHAELLARFPNIRVVGGCCGTDHRHVAEIGAACRPALAA